MNLKLYISKNYGSRRNKKSSYIRIAVIDTDIPKEYPANFVCMLPRNLNQNPKKPCKFQEKFGDQSPQIIKKLLDEALETEDDIEFKNELMKRLKILKSKSKNLIICNDCGREFKARKFGYRLQKTCYECKAKRYKKPNKKG